MSENIQIASMPLEDYKSACDTIREITNSPEVITSGELAEKIEEVFEVGKNAEWNEIKGTASGEIIAINDISPIEHEMGVKVRGKNLLNSNLRLTPRTDSGVTIQYLPEEDCYLLNGTSTDRVASLVYEDVFINDYITITTKVVSGTIDNPNNGYTVFYAGGKNDINDSVSNWVDAPIGYDDNRTSYNIRKYIGCTWFYFDKGITFNNYKVKIQIEKGTTSTSYAPYIPDISAVNVLKLGGNLLNFPSVYSWNGVYPAHINTNVKTVLKPNIRYALSYDEIEYSAQSDGLVFVVNGNAILAWTEAKKPNYFTLDKEVTDFYIYTNGWNYNASENTTATVTNLRIYMAEDGYLDYESYIEPTEYTPDADGVVQGVTSLYPSTTLITNTDGVVIDATYNKEISEVDEVPERIEAIYDEGCVKGNRELWDLLTNNNTRTDYNKTFYGSGFEYIRPPYQIQPTGNYALNQTFTQSKNLKKIEAKYFDFSKKPRGTMNAYGVYYTFNGTNLEEIEDLGIQPEFSLVLTYSWCTKLRKIAIVRVDENTKYDEAFNYCYALEEVRFEGTIGQNGLNFQWSTKLSKASWLSIISCLSTTTSGLSITGSLDSIKKAFETSPGANDGDTSTEWLELETSRSNWKINLL